MLAESGVGFVTAGTCLCHIPDGVEEDGQRIETMN